MGELERQTFGIGEPARRSPGIYGPVLSRRVETGRATRSLCQEPFRAAGNHDWRSFLCASARRQRARDQRERLERYSEIRQKRRPVAIRRWFCTATVIR